MIEIEEDKLIELQRKAELWTKVSGDFYLDFCGKPVEEMVLIPLERRRRYTHTIAVLVERLRAIIKLIEQAENEEYEDSWTGHYYMPLFLDHLRDYAKLQVLGVCDKQ